jgi:hypothetical protein
MEATMQTFHDYFIDYRLCAAKAIKARDAGDWHGARHWSSFARGTIVLARMNGMWI